MKIFWDCPHCGANVYSEDTESTQAHGVYICSRCKEFTYVTYLATTVATRVEPPYDEKMLQAELITSWYEKYTGRSRATFDDRDYEVAVLLYEDYVESESD